MARLGSSLLLSAALLGLVLLLGSLESVQCQRGRRGGGGDSGEDYYAILGVARDADEQTIKKAYKKLAL